VITLDASVVIAHLSSADPHHAAATEHRHRRAAGGFVMHSLHLAEVLVGTVRAGRGHELLDDPTATGITVAARPADEPLRSARCGSAPG
jgi:hypothetical protein